MPGILIAEGKDEEPTKPPASIVMDSDESKGIGMGDEITLTIKGKVKGIHSMFDEKFVSVELGDQQIISSEMNKADKALKDMKQAVEIMNEADRGLRDSLEA